MAMLLAHVVLATIKVMQKSIISIVLSLIKVNLNKLFQKKKVCFRRNEPDFFVCTSRTRTAVLNLLWCPHLYDINHTAPAPQPEQHNKRYKKSRSYNKKSRLYCKKLA